MGLTWSGHVTCDHCALTADATFTLTRERAVRVTTPPDWEVKTQGYFRGNSLDGDEYLTRCPEHRKLTFEQERLARPKEAP